MKNGLRRLTAALLMSGLMVGTGWAQDRGVWIQIEALPTLSQGQDRAAAYTQTLPDVNGYDLGSGWFGIALGPYSEDEADQFLALLRADRAIPSDSYIVDGSRFGSQFWPNGARQTAGQVVEAPLPAPQVEVILEELPPEPVIIAAEETDRQARNGEADLGLDGRKDLQTALQWAGFYNSTIDGLFGRGTRNSMAAWQEANNYEITGVLTSNQRAALMGQYNAILDGMDLALVRDDATGIEMQMPMGVVSFDAYSPPFARFEATGDIDAQVLLISQPGTQDRLFGLYEILQTLEIIPTDGPRERRSSSFTIEGVDNRQHSYTQARLIDGEIKGFTLVWPVGDEERRARVLDIMRESFNPITGVLDPSLASTEEQSLDLVSGLAVRLPVRARSGFYIDATGTVLTSIETVQSCGEILLDDSHAAQIVHQDADLGLAVLAPISPIAPLANVTFQTAAPRLQARVAVAGYPFGGLLTAPSLTFGTLADGRGLNGEAEIKRLAIGTQEGDSGGPVFDNGGAVIGMLLPTSASGRVLPGDVGFSVHAPAIMASLDGAGIEYTASDNITAITPERLTRAAVDVTVLVSCWE